MQNPKDSNATIQESQESLNLPDYPSWRSIQCSIGNIIKQSTMESNGSGEDEWELLDLLRKEGVHQATEQ
jgi:hypothetical protein